MCARAQIGVRIILSSARVLLNDESEAGLSIFQCMDFCGSICACCQRLIIGGGVSYMNQFMLLRYVKSYIFNYIIWPFGGSDCLQVHVDNKSNVIF